MSFSPKVEMIFMERSGNKTFSWDETLPSLPLPELDQTLRKYLDSLKPFTTPEEFDRSCKIVEDFRKGIGAELNEKLKLRAKTERNWVEKFWENYVYLQSRQPLLPYGSMSSILPRWNRFKYESEEDQLKLASFVSYHTVNFWISLRQELLRPNESRGKRFSMVQYRRMYNTVRVPEKVTDSLECYFKTSAEGPSPSHVVILCQGRIFEVDGVDETGRPISPVEWENVLREIVERTRDRPGENVGILTCDDRTNWSKNRKHLTELSAGNREVLKSIDTSLYVLILDDDTPKSEDLVVGYNLCGDLRNRWADKSFGIIVYKNGMSGTICDHTPFDGIVATTFISYLHIAVEEDKENWSRLPVKRIPVKELRFEVDDTLRQIIGALSAEMTTKARRDVFLIRKMFFDFGKDEIRKLNIHPDTFVQMAIQLAYQKLHRKPGPCYESATTRAYYNGRTETVRACTAECVEWVQAMLRGDPIQKKLELLLRAVKRHGEIMSEASNNAGCDRHLFGLYCTALEEGFPIPELFSDPAYFKSGGGGNFVLSTSCTGFNGISGGTCAMCLDGYGVFYNFLADRISFVIAVNPQSNETNVDRYFDSLSSSLNEMRRLVLSGKNSSSKL